MINVDSTIKQLYRQDSLDKTYLIFFRDADIYKTNSDIITESLSISESVCSTQQFKLGLCEASNAQISLYIDENVTGDEMTIIEMIGQYNGIIEFDADKGLQLISEDAILIDEGDFSELAEATFNFVDTKFYLFVGKFTPSEFSSRIYLSGGNSTKNIYFAFRNLLNSSDSVNFYIPLSGKELKYYSKILTEGVDSFIPGHTDYGTSTLLSTENAYTSGQNQNGTSGNDGYTSGETWIKVFKFTGCNHIKIHLKMQVIEAYNDFACIWKGSHSDYTFTNYQISNSITHNKITSTSLIDRTLEVTFAESESDVAITVGFKSTSTRSHSSLQYGFWCEIEGYYDTETQVYPDEYTYSDISGYYSLYEFTKPILPLGTFYVDSCRKSTGDETIREIQGYDKFVLSKIDDYYKKTVESKIDVSDFITDVSYGTALQLGNNTEDSALTGEEASFSVLSTTTSEVELPDIVYSTEPSNAKKSNGTYIEFENGFTDTKYKAHSEDPRYHYGRFRRTVTIKPKSIEKYRMAEVDDYPDLVYYNRYPDISDDERIYMPVCRHQGLDAVATYNNRYAVTDWAYGYYMYTGDTTQMAIGNAHAHITQKSMHSDVSKHYYESIIRTIAKQTDFKYSDDTYIPEFMYIYHWDQNEMNNIRRIIEYDGKYINGTNYSDWFSDLDMKIYTTDIHPRFPGERTESQVREVTKITYSYWVYYGYDWSIPITSTTIISDFIYKKQDQYNSGKISQEEFVKGGASQYQSSPQFEWTEQMIKTTIQYQILNYRPGLEYRFYIDNPMYYGASLMDNAAYNTASANGNLIINEHSNIKNIISNNSTESVVVDNEGRFTISFISSMSYEGRDIVHDIVEFSDEELNIPSPLNRITIGSSLNSFNGMELIVPSKLNINRSRRDIVASYFELLGSFLRFNRLGITELIQNIANSEGDTSRYYYGYPGIITLSDDVVTQNIISPNDINSIVRLYPEKNITAVSGKEYGIELSDVEYAQIHIMYPTRDLTIVYETQEELEFEDPVYVVGNVEFYEKITFVTIRYSLYKDNVGNYNYHINSHLSDILSFDDSVRAIAENMGDITINNQTEFREFVGSVGEGVEIDEEYVTVHYVKSIEYTAGEESGSYEVENILNTVDCPNYIEDNVIYATNFDRYYIQAYAREVEYNIPINRPNFDYTIRVNHPLTDVITMIDTIKTMASVQGELIVDRGSYLSSLLNNFGEYVESSIDDGVLTIKACYISRIEYSSYNGINNSSINLIDRSILNTENAISYVQYLGDYPLQAVFSHGYDHYYIMADIHHATYTVPIYNSSYRLDVNYHSNESIIERLEDMFEDLIQDALDDAGEFDVDRRNDLIYALTNFVNSHPGVQDENTVTVDYISKLSLIKETIVNTDNSTISYLDNVVSKINYIDLTEYNFENVETYLVRSLYIDDKMNTRFTGVNVVKSNPTENEVYYPFYYNLDGTTGYKDSVHYYVVQNNFFVDNFEISEQQLVLICQDILNLIKNADFYSLSTTYKALPYTEVCDKVFIRGLNNSNYVTIILRRIMQGNLGMTDDLEIDFND